MIATEGRNAKQRIAWSPVLTSALLAALGALAPVLLTIHFFQGSSTDLVDRICPPDLVEAPRTGNPMTNAVVKFVASVVVCGFKLLFFFLAVYLPLAVLLSVLMTRYRLRERRWLHAILAALLSLPAALAVLYVLACFV